MVDRLHHPFAEGAIFAIWPSSLLQTVTSPKPILNRKPSEELYFRGRPYPPNRRANGGRRCSIELSLVSRFGGIDPTLGEVPSDLIHCVLVEINVSQFDPKGDVLAGMLHREVRFHVDLGDPTIIMQGFF